jgi:general secretion pathway protein G
MLSKIPPSDTPDSRYRKNEAGYTHLEVLVVLGITVLLAAVVGPRLMQHFGKAKHDTAQIQLKSIATALSNSMDIGHYPSTDVGLQALVATPTGESVWNGPYLQKRDGLLDPWRQPYRYALPGQHGPYDLYSLGRDNSEGGEGEDADIHNW